MEWGEIFANHIYGKRLIPKIYNIKQIKEFTQLKNTKPNNPIKKKAKTWKDIFPKKLFKWLTGTWKDPQHQ